MDVSAVQVIKHMDVTFLTSICVWHDVIQAWFAKKLRALFLKFKKSENNYVQSLQ